MWLGIAFWTGGAWIMYYVDAPTVTVRVLDRHRIDRRCISSPSCSPPRPICWPAGRASRSAPTCARGRASRPRCWMSRASPSPTRRWRGEPRATRQAACGRRRSATASIAAPASPPVRPASTSATACQLECINCGLCIDACNHVMERTGRPGWLITWDTLADQTAKAARQADPLPAVPAAHHHLCRRRWCSRSPSWAWLWRCGPASACPCCMTARRCSCALASGDLRNGYTVKIVNKSPARAVFELSMQGLPGATLTEANEELGAGRRCWVCRCPADSVGTFRVMVDRPAGGAGGRLGRPSTSSLRNTATGEVTVYHSVFMGPARSCAEFGGQTDAMNAMRRHDPAAQALGLATGFPGALAGAMGVVIAVNIAMAYSALQHLPGQRRQRRVRPEQPLRRSAGDACSGRRRSAGRCACGAGRRGPPGARADRPVRRRRWPGRAVEATAERPLGDRRHHDASRCLATIAPGRYRRRTRR